MKLKSKRLRRVAILPALFTLGNLLCGFGALTYAIRDHYLQAAWLILLAMAVFDSLDGLVARATKSVSNFGAHLDSLADMVSFGIAPAFLSYSLIHKSNSHLISYKFTFLICAFYVVCVALRLARYNVETAEDFTPHQFFAGLPSPGAAAMISSIIIIHKEFGASSKYGTFFNDVIPVILPVATLILAFLMVSRLRYAHLLNKIIKSKHNFIRLVEIMLCVLLVIFQPEATLFVGFLIYTMSGLVWYFISPLFPKYRVKSLIIEKPAIK